MAMMEVALASATRVTKRIKRTVVAANGGGSHGLQNKKKF
jgi:hypothetical protein